MAEANAARLSADYKAAQQAADRQGDLRGEVEQLRAALEAARKSDMANLAAVDKLRQELSAAEARARSASAELQVVASSQSDGGAAKLRAEVDQLRAALDAARGADTSSQARLLAEIEQLRKALEATRISGSSSVSVTVRWATFSDSREFRQCFCIRVAMPVRLRLRGCWLMPQLSKCRICARRWRSWLRRSQPPPA